MTTKAEGINHNTLYLGFSRLVGNVVQSEVLIRSEKVDRRGDQCLFY